MAGACSWQRCCLDGACLCLRPDHTSGGPRRRPCLGKGRGRRIYCTVINMQKILLISDYTAIGMPITYPLISINIPLTSYEYSIISPIRMMWAKQYHKTSPKSQFLYIGGLETIPSHGWFMTWFYPHWSWQTNIAMENLQFLVIQNITIIILITIIYW